MTYFVVDIVIVINKAHIFTSYRNVMQCLIFEIIGHGYYSSDCVNCEQVHLWFMEYVTISDQRPMSEQPKHQPIFYFESFSALLFYWHLRSNSTANTVNYICDIFNQDVKGINFLGLHFRSIDRLHFQIKNYYRQKLWFLNFRISFGY